MRSVAVDFVTNPIYQQYPSIKTALLFIVNLHDNCKEQFQDILNMDPTVCGIPFEILPLQNNLSWKKNVQN